MKDLGCKYCETLSDDNVAYIIYTKNKEAEVVSHLAFISEAEVVLELYPFLVDDTFTIILWVDGIKWRVFDSVAIDKIDINTLHKERVISTLFDKHYESYPILYYNNLKSIRRLLRKKC